MTIISAVIKNPGVVAGTSQREPMQNMTILTLSIQQREPGLEKGGGGKDQQRGEKSRVISVSEAYDPAGDLQNGRPEFRIMSKRWSGGICTDFKRFGVFSFLQRGCLLSALWSQEVMVGLGSLHLLGSRKQTHSFCPGRKEVSSPPTAQPRSKRALLKRPRRAPKRKCPLSSSHFGDSRFPSSLHIVPRRRNAWGSHRDISSSSSADPRSLEMMKKKRYLDCLN